MAGRRSTWFLALAAVLTAYLAVGSWVSWVALVTLALLPWVSLLLSFPAIRGFRLAPTGVDSVPVGEDAYLWILGTCYPPMPPFRGDLQLRSCLTGEISRYRPEMGLPTAHCGALEVTVVKEQVFDYLGLFAFRPRHKEGKTVLVRPRPIPLDEPLDLESFQARRWYPKPGGGFSENHELRPYRPGDSMAGIHWKLTAKTSSLVVREPMEPEQGRMLLTMDLNGTPDQLDRKLGQMLWTGGRLLELDRHFELRVLTGNGILELPVGDVRSLNAGLDTLLRQPLAREGSIQDQPAWAAWQYYIGGNAREA